MKALAAAVLVVALAQPAAGGELPEQPLASRCELVRKVLEAVGRAGLGVPFGHIDLQPTRATRGSMPVVAVWVRPSGDTGVPLFADTEQCVGEATAGHPSFRAASEDTWSGQGVRKAFYIVLTPARHGALGISTHLGPVVSSRVQEAHPNRTYAVFFGMDGWAIEGSHGWRAMLTAPFHPPPPLALLQTRMLAEDIVRKAIVILRQLTRLFVDRPPTK